MIFRSSFTVETVDIRTKAKKNNICMEIPYKVEQLIQFSLITTQMILSGTTIKFQKQSF